jgi:hypothetical protein
MKKILLKVISGVALAVMMVLATEPIPASGQNGKGRRIEGTWRVEVTGRDCQSGAPIRTFSSLNTFLPGGSMLQASSGSSPARVSAGHGVWEHTRGQSFTNTLVVFRFNLDGTYAGTQKVTGDIELGGDSDEFTSTVSFETADPTGNVIATGCATAVGRRLE